MDVKYIAGVTLSVSFGFSAQASALGLGEIELQSHLNEPFKAKIEVIKEKNDSKITHINARLGSNEDFIKANLDKPFFLNGFEFTLKQDKNKQHFIEVSSDDSVDEPYVDFLLKLVWPDGTLLRQYTVLLDPIDYKTLPGSGDAVGGALATKHKTLPKAKVNKASLAPSYGPIKSLDTMWSIAKKHKPTSSISIEETIWAIYKKNPHAFINSDINRLKAGEILKLPTLEEIKSFNDKNYKPEKPAEPKANNNLSSNNKPPKDNFEIEFIKAKLKQIEDHNNQLMQILQAKDNEIQTLENKLQDKADENTAQIKVDATKINASTKESNQQVNTSSEIVDKIFNSSAIMQKIDLDNVALGAKEMVADAVKPYVRAHVPAKINLTPSVLADDLVTVEQLQQDNKVLANNQLNENLSDHFFDSIINQSLKGELLDYTDKTFKAQTVQKAEIATAPVEVTTTTSYLSGAKIVGIFATIGLSFGAFVWYRRKFLNYDNQAPITMPPLNMDENENQKEQEIANKHSQVINKGVMDAFNLDDAISAIDEELAEKEELIVKNEESYSVSLNVRKDETSKPVEPENISFDNAQELIDAKDYKGAKFVLQKLVQKDGENIEYKSALLKVYEKLNNTKEYEALLLEMPLEFNSDKGIDFDAKQ